MQWTCHDLVRLQMHPTMQVQRMPFRAIICCRPAFQASPPAAAFCSQIRCATGLGQPCSCTEVRPAAWWLAAAAPAARDTGENAAGGRCPSEVRRDFLHA